LQKYGTGTTQTKKKDRKITPSSGKREKPSQLFGHEEQIKEMVVEPPDYTLAEYCEYWQDKTGVRLSDIMSGRLNII
jgi:putative transposase